MRLVRSTTRKELLICPVLLLLSVLSVQAQENSPYSRYGLGDMVPNQSVVSRSMGGISAGFVDYDRRFDLKQLYPKTQSINFVNPATYSKMRITSFDLGFEVDTRTLHSNTDARKFSTSSATFSYLQLGVPLSRKHEIGMNIGLRPITRISYKIAQQQKEFNPVTGNLIDSVNVLNEGSGGAYEVFAGIGKAFKNLSVGVNVGYMFGTKDYSTRKSFLNDSVLYYPSNYESKASFGGLMVNAGVQYTANLTKTTKLVVGAYGNLRQKLNATQDIIRETFNYDANGATYQIDSVDIQKDISGKIDYPSNVGAGFTLEKLDRWMIGADFSTTSWSQYRFFGTKDSSVKNNWTLRIGGQFTPDLFNAKTYWGRVTYRAA